MAEMSDMEWDVVKAIWGMKARVPASSIDADMNPQRIDANAAHLIKDQVLAALGRHANEAAAKFWDEGFTDGMRQWEMRRKDPDHPITRINPYLPANPTQENN